VIRGPSGFAFHPYQTVHRRWGLLARKTRGGRATKVKAVAVRHGHPLAVGIASGRCAEVRLAEETLNQWFTKKLTEKLIGDEAYDSNKLDAQPAFTWLLRFRIHTRYELKAQNVLAFVIFLRQSCKESAIAPPEAPALSVRSKAR
jgi:hypothetical protein